MLFPPTLTVTKLPTKSVLTTLRSRYRCLNNQHCRVSLVCTPKAAETSNGLILACATEALELILCDTAGNKFFVAHTEREGCFFHTSTLQTYAHCLPGQQEDAVTPMLDEQLFGRPEKNEHKEQ